MAGMFYSLQETVEKLNKTEEEIKQIVAEGKLREFRDGPSLLFKVEEVEALIPQGQDETLEEALGPEALEAEALEPVALEAEDAEPAMLEPDDSAPAVLTPEDLEPEEVEPEVSAQEPVEAGLSDFDIEALGDTAGEIPDVESLEAEVAEPEALEPEAPSPADTDDILLAPETAAPVIPSDLTDADTAITSMGTNVLGESDAGYDITDDTMAETAVPMGTAGTTPEVPLEEIEEDVNLDSFGSGSGLLDLSLQADDTSLGGILDEIYTASDEVAEPAEAEAEAPEAVAVEAEEMVPEDDLAAPQMAAAAPALARPFIEAPPDAQSNTLGMLLFLPLLIVIYTMVVAVSGLRGVMPSLLEPIQGFIWYIMGGAGALALAVTAAAFLLTGERDATAKKAKKPKAKKEKKPKAKKEKKPKAKKEKKPKKVKEKKPKKAK
ncbi:MAG: hypothetical protein ACYTBS_01785 [Planctomycetota bacterium]|jgi:hypothetical protein